MHEWLSVLLEGDVESQLFTHCFAYLKGRDWFWPYSRN